VGSEYTKNAFCGHAEAKTHFSAFGAQGTCPVAANVVLPRGGHNSTPRNLYLNLKAGEAGEREGKEGRGKEK